MSDYPVASRKSDFKSPPRAYQADGPEGQVAVLAVSTTAIAVDLSKGFSQAAYDGTKGSNPATPSFNYLTIEADVDIGIIFGPTLASVSSGNAPVIATAGSLSSNAYSGTAGTCFVVKANTEERFLLSATLDTFVAIVATGAGKVRMYQSSPNNA